MKIHQPSAPDVLIALLLAALITGVVASMNSYSFSGEPCGVGTRLIGDPVSECERIVEMKDHH